METQVTNQEDHINHSPEPSMDEILESDDEPYTTGPVTMVGDYEYIRVLDLPALNLSLPIMSDWDYERLKTAPCRQFGSAATDDLVIAGHNDINHFGSLGMLKAGRLRHLYRHRRRGQYLRRLRDRNHQSHRDRKGHRKRLSPRPLHLHLRQTIAYRDLLQPRLNQLKTLRHLR